MEYREYDAGVALRRHVQCVWRLRDAAPSGAPQTVYPDGRCELIIHLADPMQMQSPAHGWQTQGRCLFAAQARSAIRLRATGTLDCVGVRLRPEASAALFNGSSNATPLATWIDQVLDVQQLDAPFAAALTAGLRHGGDPIAPTFIGLLSGRLNAWRLDARITAAVAALDRTSGNLKLRALAQSIGMSVRSLQVRFVSAVGLTVKEYALVRRLQATIRQLDAAAGALADTAIEMGFADQAHATRAMRAFAGLTPARLRRALLAQRDGDQTLAMAAAFVRGESMPT